MNQKEKREYHSRSNGIFFEIKRTLFRKKSRFQDIEVIENPYFGHILFLDGLVQTTEKDEFFYHEMLIHPAMATHPMPRQVLIIGGGDGGALKQTLQYAIEKVRMVDDRPAWQEDVKCHGCFACLNYCPEESIQVESRWYLRSYTEENGRYHHRAVTANEIARQKPTGAS